MSSERFNSGDNIPIRTRFEDVNGAGITNATGVIFIQRTSDNEYWNGSAFQVARVSIVMDEFDETNSPGVWRFDFDSSVGDLIDNYAFEAVDTSGNSVNLPEQGFAFVGGYLDQLLTDSSKMLGLMRENTKIKNTVYDGANNLISADIFQYDSKVNVDLDDEVTGFIRKWTIVSPHTGLTMDSFKQRLEP